ncbi:MAG: hypothetical protein AAFV45_11765 [Pseudomonadota bacterium]
MTDELSADTTRPASQSSHAQKTAVDNAAGDPENTGQPSTDSKAPAGEDAKIRALNILVIVLGVILVLGFFTVIGRIIYLVTRPSEPTVSTVAQPVSISANQAIDELALPSGANIKTLNVGNGQMVLHYQVAATQHSGRTDSTVPANTRSLSEVTTGEDPHEGIVVIDIASGKVIRRFRITTSAAAE